MQQTHAFARPDSDRARHSGGLPAQEPGARRSRRAHRLAGPVVAGLCERPLAQRGQCQPCLPASPGQRGARAERRGRAGDRREGAGETLSGQPQRHRPHPEDLELAAERDAPAFFLGGEPGIAEAAAKNLTTRIPRLRVAGCRHGFFGRAEEAGILRQIKESSTKVLIVAMGNPKQELWLDRHLGATGAYLGVALGAFLNFAVLREAGCEAEVVSVTGASSASGPSRRWSAPHLGPPGFDSYLNGLDKDHDAAIMDLTLPHSNGPTEGVNTKIKLLKRQTCGKASFGLLRERILLTG